MKMGSSKKHALKLRIRNTAGGTSGPWFFKKLNFKVMCKNMYFFLGMWLLSYAYSFENFIRLIRANFKDLFPFKKNCIKKNGFLNVILKKTLIMVTKRLIGNDCLELSHRVDGLLLGMFYNLQGRENKT